MKKIEPIQSAKLATSPGPFSTGVKANGFLFLSGPLKATVEMTITSLTNKDL